MHYLRLILFVIIDHINNHLHIFESLMISKVTIADKTFQNYADFDYYIGGSRFEVQRFISA